MNLDTCCGCQRARVKLKIIQLLELANVTRRVSTTSCSVKSLSLVNAKSYNPYVSKYILSWIKSGSFCRLNLRSMSLATLEYGVIMLQINQRRWSSVLPDGKMIKPTANGKTGPKDVP